MPERLTLPIHGPEHVPGGPDPIPFGDALFEIKVFEDDEVVLAGDGAFKFAIPEDLDTALLTKAEAWITDTGGAVTVSLWNETQGVDLLSTPLTIDAGELNSKDASVPHVVDDTTNEVAWGDEIWINVDVAAGKGLGVAVYFLSRAVNAIVVRGAKGEPGGVTEFEGDWSGSTVYPAGSVVGHDGTAYLSTADHTSDGLTEPGVGVDWETVWTPLVDLPTSAEVNCVINGNNYVLQDGIKGSVVVPFDATISEATLLADVAGDVEVDIWKSDFGGYPPDSGDSIVGTPLTLTGSIKTTDATLSGWTTALSAGDILVYYLASVSTITRLTVALKLTKG